MKNSSAPLIARAIALSLLLASASSQVARANVSNSLEEAIHEAWSGSPQIKAQQALSEVAESDVWRRFVFNEPQFQYTNADDDTANTFGLSLTTSFPGKSFALSRLDSAKSRGQRLEYGAKKHDLAKSIAQAYIDCATAQATFELQKATTADLETVFKTLRALYETGHSTQAEKIGAELQARQAHLDLTMADERQAVLCRKYLAVLEVSGAHPAAAAVEGELPLPDDIDNRLVNEIGADTSDQSRAAAAIDVAQATLSTAAWSQAPDLTFSFARNHYVYLPGSPAGKEWTTTYGVSLSLPIFFPFHELNEVKRAKSQAWLDRNTAELQKIGANSDVADGAAEYKRSRARLQELRAKDLALGEALVESTYSAYRAGKLGYAELVLSRKTLTDLRTQDIQLRASIINSHLRCLSRCENGQVPTPLSKGSGT